MSLHATPACECCAAIRETRRALRTRPAVHWLARFAILALCMLPLADGTLAAAEPPGAPQANPSARVQNGDPYLPPASRTPSTLPPASGDALKAQILQKLQRDFERADVDHAGSVTQAQASRAGLGLVARHFDKIDTKHSGRVTFDQVRDFLRSEGEQL